MNDWHFGLHRRPFPATPDQACYYPASSHENALERLRAGLADGEGVLLLVGAPGTGKTLLCHRLLAHLDEQAECVCLTHTHLGDRAGLLQAILFDLSLPHAGKNAQEMRLALIDHLLNRYSVGKRTVLIIDEAQHLGPDLLEELRLLGNLEGQGGKAVQVVLVGQLELLDTLSSPELASLRQRLSVRAMVEPMGVEEAADYLLHHLRAAGGKAEQILGEEALELLARSTHGLPRLLNQAGHQAFRLAVAAGASEMEVEAVYEALAVLGLTADEPLAQPAGESESPEKNLGLEGGSLPRQDPADRSCRLFIAPGRSA